MGISRPGIARKAQQSVRAVTRRGEIGTQGRLRAGASADQAKGVTERGSVSEGGSEYSEGQPESKAPPEGTNEMGVKRSARRSALEHSASRARSRPR